jgi:hypothetical protein
MRVNDFVLRDRLIKRSLNAAWRYPVHEAIPILPEYRVMDAAHIVVIRNICRQFRLSQLMGTGTGEFDLSAVRT